MARFLRYGLTTGACSAAAAKAAVIALLGSPVDRVVIPTPIGIRFEIPVKCSKRLSEDSAVATVVKDAGDDVDATNKIEISAKVRMTSGSEITVRGGKGVGKVTKPGLAVPPGECAINPVPRRMIRDAVKEALPAGRGAEVVIEIPEGEEVAKRTMNARLGIVGGISVLGTTGVVKPFSMAAYRRSLSPQIDIAMAKGHQRIFMVPGNIGERIVRDKLNPPGDSIVQTGDFVGYMLDRAVEKGAKEIVLVGHAGKLVKLAVGIFNTHHKMGDARAEVIAAYAGAAGADPETIRRILRSNTTEEAAGILKGAGLLRATFDAIAERVKAKASERVGGKAKIGAVIVSLDGQVLGADSESGCGEHWRS
ncbi:MAG: cobalt-precorrin-5B (C(1))-methyltransferase CbiD [Candidatus Verstraetearchaeota archaeon]|nr:cobalt-precorrin-5B (C(1))-methyltransferase CbiD [Candidatus Verstraetearchaeota archaeon]